MTLKIPALIISESMKLFIQKDFFVNQINQSAVCKVVYPGNSSAYILLIVRLLQNWNIKEAQLYWH